MKFAIPFVAACALFASATATLAQSSTALPPVDAEVRKVDTDAQKITLRHGAIPNIDMAAMTMVFRVKDAALLQTLKAGDKVKVTIDRVNGALTVMSLEAAGP